MSNPVVSRLRRALAEESDYSEAADLLEALALSVLDQLPLDQAALLESILDQYARAAEELGYDASVEEIRSRADELNARPN